MGQIPLTSLFISLLTLSLVSLSTSNCTGSSNQVRAGYWLSTSNHYSPLSNINTSLYTHLYYSTSIDSRLLITSLPPPDQVPLLATFSSTLKSANPSLKTLLSISTDDQNSKSSNAAFSAMAADPVSRSAFVDSAIGLARANAFDGLDFAWQFPASPADLTNLGILIAEWRAQIEDEAKRSSRPPLLLTATVYFSNHIFDGPTDDLDYPIDAISSNLDWINAVSFGFHKNSNVTIFDAPLYDKASHFSVSYGTISWLDAGIPSCKLVLGIPLYGKSWFLKNKAKNGINSPVVAGGPKQRISNRTGSMAYFEIEQLLRDPTTVSQYDNSTVSAYFYSGGVWVSFDDHTVVEEKIEFALKYRLLASEAWLENYDSSQFEDESGYKEAAAPFQLPPKDQAPTISEASSASTKGSLKDSYFHLHFSLLLFLLIYQTRACQKL
ncbi:Acidic mammalian chitinase [Ananas comosus]|uniref:Acidic mammalian chitinase n=1 Tax=Ananas comosus TaxID=4615 RepID=A0A199UW72_ANACO|nr:Acidic mammalian chitinase [Ananas comosus]